MQSARRIKLSLILLILAASVLVLLAWTQTWVHVTIGAETGVELELQVDGATASPALTALALAGLALAGALTIAGPVIRLILGVLEILIGASVFIASYSVIQSPAAASGPAVTDATGIAGNHSIELTVTAASVTAWPFVAIAGGVVMVIAGLAVIVTSRRWPGSTKRFQAVSLAPVDAESAAALADAPDAHSAQASTSTTQASTPMTADAAADAVVDWDELSRGEDPTAS
ncbi:Trp biosynthesis-associated membrane protein [Leifsonia sp. A12D58]|uniref:Trp biosynthesis-associated membrane protein n=1 Tax=Leifsonia sp. A12D58 TaxID=3397674 RepID=UPI0039DFDD21